MQQTGQDLNTIKHEMDKSRITLSHLEKIRKAKILSFCSLGLFTPGTIPYIYKQKSKMREELEALEANRNRP